MTRPFPFEDDGQPRRLLTRAEFDRMLELCRDPEYVASLPCPCGMVEVDNPVRREVRHRRGCQSGARS